MGEWHYRCLPFLNNYHDSFLADAIHRSGTQINWQTGTPEKMWNLYYKKILIRLVHLHILTMRIHQSLHHYRGSLSQLLNHFFDFWRVMSICNWMSFSLSKTMTADRVYTRWKMKLFIICKWCISSLLHFFKAYALSSILIWAKTYDENSRSHEMDREDDREHHDNVKSFDLSAH